MKKLTVSRRTFAKTFAGLSAGAYAQFTGLLRDTFVQAQAPSLRLICLTQPHGKTMLWHPRAPGGAYGSAGETGWTLDFPNASLSPLEKHKDSMVIIEGLDFYCTRRPGNDNSAGHQCAPAALTGTNIRSNNDRRPTGPSIDTAVARHLQVEPFVFYSDGSCKSWDATGSVYPDVGAAMQYDPINGAYKRLFANLTTSGTAPDPRATRAKEIETASLKFLRDDAAALRTRLAGPERVKLDLHLEAIAAMERKLTTTVSAGCRKPPAPASSRDYLLSVQDKHKLTMDFIAASFACNLTRVATFHMGMNSGYPGVMAHAHNDITHNAPYNDPNHQNTIIHSTMIHRFCASHVAYLFDQLKSISEGGKTIYDNTIVLWTNELGNAQQHHGWNLPFVVAGGGGPWRKGRYLKLRDVALSSNGTNSKGGEDVAHNHLLVSIAQQFGLSTDQTFGDKDIIGPLKAL